MIKVPATPAGIPAIEQLIAEGVNVNVTLLFAVGAYARVVEAWLRGRPAPELVTHIAKMVADASHRLIALGREVP